MATVAALLHHKLPHYFWTGFYRVRGDRLLVGPYQGPLACQTLKKRQGTCWAAVIQERTIIVPDVRLFPGHVSCDARSRSEIVVPLCDSGGKTRAVLDVDSTTLNAFSSIDAEWLERITALI
jgi:L-methionine (R)-S-oxide reductase